MSSYDIQSYLRISEEQPHLMGLKQHELIVSPDLISWKMYNPPLYWDGNEYILDSLGNANSDLPVLGLELRYGLDDINYQSLWSERLTALALWKSIKLGLVLPTNGWSSMSNDLFEQERNLTHAGIGVAGEFDFPFKVIPKSGLFRLSFSYVFGDAETSNYKGVNLNPNAYNSIDEYKMLVNQDVNKYTDYLIRYHAQLLYTFGIAIDDDYKFRFGVGGTVYNAEMWHNYLDSAETGNLDFFNRNYDNEVIGGLTGRVEFLATNVTTPWGASLQYFDEGLSGNIWLQIPIIKNLLAIRFDAKGFSPVFRDEDYAWETGALFTPMIRAIVTF